MGKIWILPDHIANRIAAGEVVRRPASVIRELIDNSLDAEATHIIIRIEHGGKRKIEVIDNGCGMDKEDAVLAFERHATSKINSEKDLEALHTLGFRGEALASISSVSQVVMETRPHSAHVGTRVVIHGGMLKRVESVAVPVGTRVSVHRLFYNVPARRKFLKSVRIEVAHILRIVQAYALSFPAVQFELFHQGKELLFFPPEEEVQGRIERVLGIRERGLFVPIDFEHREYKITGVITGPDGGSRYSEDMYLFVNSRYVRDPWLSKIVRQIWKKYGSRYPYPQCALFLECRPEDVDVNVHPMKHEVRFRDPSIVYSCIESALAEGFRTSRSSVHLRTENHEQREERELPQMLPRDEMPHERVKKFIHRPVPLQITPDSRSEIISNHTGIQASEPIPHESKNVETHGGDLIVDAQHMHGVQKGGKVLGQIFNCYIVLEENDALLLLDQHLVHERYLYEMWLKKIEQGVIPPQQLLIPIVYSPGVVRMEVLQEWLGWFRQHGWEIELFGRDTISVRTIPSGVWVRDVETVLNTLIDELFLNERGSEVHDTLALKTLACRSAIKKGDPLSPDQLNFLARIWYELDVPQVCPHGRIMAVRLYDQDLHRAFGRHWNFESTPSNQGGTEKE